MSSIPPYTDFAEALADAAARTIMPLYRQALETEDKAVDAAFDPVTIADRNAERAMRVLIEETFPDHGIIGEEYGVIRPDAEFVWVLDPIDGTKAFICGMPSWGTLIGLLHRGTPILGVIDQPFLKERFVGGQNYASALIDARQVRLKTRPCRDLAHAHVYIGGSMTTNPLLPEVIARLKGEVQLLRTGGDAYTYAMLAKGHVDIIIDAGLELHDIAALIPLVSAAGGITGDWRGRNPIGSGFFQACGDACVMEALTGIIGNLIPN